MWRRSRWAAGEGLTHIVGCQGNARTIKLLLQCWAICVDGWRSEGRDRSDAGCSKERRERRRELTHSCSHHKCCSWRVVERGSYQLCRLHKRNLELSSHKEYRNHVDYGQCYLPSCWGSWDWRWKGNRRSWHRGQGSTKSDSKMRRGVILKERATSVSQKSNWGTCSSNFALYFPDCKIKANPVGTGSGTDQQDRGGPRDIPINSKIIAATAVQKRWRILVVGEIWSVDRWTDGWSHGRR